MTTENTIKIVGNGSESVYVYYYPRYHDTKNVNNYYWPCKIGMSTHSAIARIKNQVKTALPETPIIGLIIKTNDAYYLEQALHAILKLYHRDIDAPGKEWFNTTPDEVYILCRMLRQC